MALQTYVFFRKDAESTYPELQAAIGKRKRSRVQSEHGSLNREKRR